MINAHKHQAAPGTRPSQTRCPICHAAGLKPFFTYTAPPAGETLFECFRDRAYYREYRRCRLCGHLAGYLELDVTQLYTGDYTKATYNQDGLRATFERIIRLPPEQSDNGHRVQRIHDYLDHGRGRKSARGRAARSLLDIGSGIGVFARGMQQQGWVCTVIDPDPRAVAHAREVIGVKAIRGDFMKLTPPGHFELITLNKVLEHVADPAAMLRKSAGLLSKDGTLYIEVPDAESAARQGPTREEFFIEHLHVFSMTSLSMLAARAGCQALRLERLQEPSGKFTLYAFLTRAESQAEKLV